MVATRGRIRRQTLLDLPLDETMLVHVLSALSVHHGPEALDRASGVCRSWRERVVAGAHLDDDPDGMIGELRSGDKPYRFDRPHDAIFLANGDVCVADCDNFRLQIVTRDGCYVREVKLDGGTSCPTGLAASGEFLYVVEHGAHRLSKLRRSCTTGPETVHRAKRLANVGSWGGGDAELRHPWGVAVAQKRVYVTDQGNDRICVFGADKLNSLFSFGGRGGGLGQLREPRGLAAHNDELFVADSRNHRIVVYSLAEAASDAVHPVRCYGGGESATAGRFALPSGVCIANDRLYVTELGNQRVQVLTLDTGLPLQCIAADGPVSGVCADDDHVCTTSLDGDHAITLWRVQDRPRDRTLMLF